MSYCKVHSKRLGIDLSPYSVGLNGIFLVTSIYIHSIVGEPEICWMCKMMTMDGYTIKLDGTDTVSTGNETPFSYIIRACHKCGIELLDKFTVGPW